MKETEMKAYVIATETVNDEATFEKYRVEVPRTVEAFGGRFVVRGGDISVLEGEWKHPRLVVIEFPSRVAAQEWYNSPGYQKVIGLRLKSTTGNLVIVDGPP
jgi:uncharacterized protein (DUF1330 family)